MPTNVDVMIILNLKDGLGNQLFEYAYALNLQRMYPNEEIVVNPYIYRKKSYKGYSFPYFKLSKRIKEVEPAKQQWWYFCFLFKLIAGMGFRIWKLSKNGRKYISSTMLRKLGERGLYVSFAPFAYYDLPKSSKTVKYIHGNFEHIHYVDAVKEQLAEELMVHLPISETDQAYIKEFEQSESVCVHIRRGDYLSPQWKALNVCTFQYYNRAINYFAERYPAAIFYVFSNTPEDIRWIKENYHFDNPNICYVTYGSPDYEEFRLMMSCKHFIISNSTFSWWAAYLGRNLQKIIVAPEIWSRNEPHPSLMLDSFVKIQVD